MKGKRLAIFLALLGMLFVFGCKEISKNLDVVKIAIDGECQEVNVWDVVYFSAQAFNSEDKVMPDITYNWSSSNPSVASITSAGVATTHQGGNAKITAEYNGLTSTATLTVNPIHSVHNCRPYEWYQTQMGTGYAQNNNCGPTSTHMAIKWNRNSGTIPTVSEIRDRHPNNGSWWYTTDVSESLTYYGVPFATLNIWSEGDLLAPLQRGHVALLCVEMKWVTYNRHDFFDRFYTFDSGHFLIVKGYSEDGNYFIVYDPNTWTNDYCPDTTAMGRNRYYRRSELINAITNWWSYAFEIGAASSSSTADLASIPVGRAGPLDSR